MTARRFAFVINRHAGNGDTERMQRLTAAMRALAHDGQVNLIDDGGQIGDAVRRAVAAGCDVVVGGGGDGTISSVASQLVDSPTALGVLPLGTLNHFAKDLGIALDPEQALRDLEGGEIRRVDIADVNGRYFVNNSSVGLYPGIVKRRELQQSRLGRGKWPAFAWATVTALARYPFVDARVSVDGRDRVFHTPFIFIGNNEYVLDGLRIGARNALDAGVLAVCVAQRTGRWGLLRLALRALFGRLREARDFRATLTRELVIETPGRKIRVSTDGEVCMLDSPLLYRLHPAALRVVVAAQAAPS